VTITDIVYLK